MHQTKSGRSVTGCQVEEVQWIKIKVCVQRYSEVPELISQSAPLTVRGFRKWPIHQYTQIISLPCTGFMKNTSMLNVPVTVRPSSRFSTVAAVCEVLWFLSRVWNRWEKVMPLKQRHAFQIGYCARGVRDLLLRSKQQDFIRI